MKSDRIDFLRSPAPPRIGWVLLFSGVAALALALWCDQQWAADRERMHLDIAARDETLRRRLAPPPVIAPSAGELRLRQVQRERNQPWVAALREIESATQAPIYLLSLHFERSAQLVELEAEAPSFDDALVYVQAIDATALSAPSLVSHEQVADPTGATRVRFAAIARWAQQ